MNGKGQYDAIIIGGGLSGLNAAYFLAKEGYNTLLCERLPKKGLLDHPCGSMIAPMKGFFTFEQTKKGIFFKELDFLFTEQMIIDYPGIMEFIMPNGNNFGMKIQHPKQELIFQIDKEKVLKELADRAEKAGAHLYYGKTVSRLVIEKGKVKGVTVGDQTFMASIVLSGEGLSRRFSQQAGLFDSKPEGYILTYALYLDNINLPPQKRGQIGYFGNELMTIPNSALLFHSYGKDKGIIFISILLDEFKWSYEKSVEVYLQEILPKIPFLERLSKQGRLYDKKACWMKLIKPSQLVADGYIGMGDSVAPFGHSSNSIAMIMGREAAETAIDALQNNDVSVAHLKDYNKWLKSDLFKGVEFEGSLISQMLQFTDEELNALADAFSETNLTPFFVGGKWDVFKTTMKMMFKKKVLKNWKVLKRLF
ncbi:MAG: hypothetical protein BAJALOKI1v1_800004 [Promethearchaeota archaeon]|nr:MAG: hypothetical protein BAJALOKI1v1_800004 [Candidatus Lokiarchaeota archaeon]